MTNYKEHLQNITTFIFDYDGVITDGTLIIMEDKEALRIGNVKDGYALQLAVKKGIQCGHYFRRKIQSYAFQI